MLGKGGETGGQFSFGGIGQGNFDEPLPLPGGGGGGRPFPGGSGGGTIQLPFPFPFPFDPLVSFEPPLPFPMAASGGHIGTYIISAGSTGIETLDEACGSDAKKE